MLFRSRSDVDTLKKIAMWGIVYHVAEELTRISIGGLQLDIKKKLPLAIGEKVYIGIL